MRNQNNMYIYIYIYLEKKERERVNNVFIEYNLCIKEEDDRFGCML
jgi:hypothetical protein